MRWFRQGDQSGVASFRRESQGRCPPEQQVQREGGREKGSVHPGQDRQAQEASQQKQAIEKLFGKMNSGAP